AVAGGQLVGVAKTHRYPQTDGVAPAGHYLGGIVIGPQWRRRGVATRLTRARMEWISKRSDRAYYFTNERNAASIGLHRAFGFEAIAVARTLHGVTADGETELVLFETHRV
ncbi:MAG: GNAT family N-acetyltransferase, partial [Actinomycetes bacterium]